MDPPTTADHQVETDAATAWLIVPGGSRRRADEWALVLASQGIESRVRRSGRGYALLVLEDGLSDARAIIDTYLSENRRNAAGDEPESPVGEATEPGVIGLVCGIVLLAAYAAVGGRSPHNPFFAAGSADAASILGGEWWRAATALCLHADLGHVIGNALFGVYFVTAAARDRGAGLALALVIGSGFIGNIANAYHHATGHDSVGASTAVFGAIGILAGLALARRSRAGWRGHRLLAPIGAALGLLAMLGTSGARVDIWAHLYGLVAGTLLGAASAMLTPRAPRWPTQVLLGAAAVSGVALCWWQALR